MRPYPVCLNDSQSNLNLMRRQRGDTAYQAALLRKWWGPRTKLSVVGQVEISMGWGPAEWLSGVPKPPMMPTKDRGSSDHQSSR